MKKVYIIDFKSYEGYKEDRNVIIFRPSKDIGSRTDESDKIFLVYFSKLSKKEMKLLALKIENFLKSTIKINPMNEKVTEREDLTIEEVYFEDSQSEQQDSEDKNSNQFESEEEKRVSYSSDQDFQSSEFGESRNVFDYRVFDKDSSRDDTESFTQENSDKKYLNEYFKK